MKKKLTFILIVFAFSLASSQEMKKEHQDVIKTFIDCIENRNIEKLKTFIAFPFKRRYPLPHIKDETDFMKRYDKIFDDKLTQTITKSDLNKDWSAVGWRGIMLNRGALWIDYDGRLLSLNLSDTEQTIREKIIEADKNSIHNSLGEFEQPILLAETKKFRVRIDVLSNGKYRYASWSINAEMNEKPDLIIENGKQILNGYRGENISYEFINGDYKYECIFNNRGDRELCVYKNGNKILTQPFLIVNH